jgi:diguanylate cyclase (GGDEF)-like protein/PAS domain S-box-containing protein
MNISTKILLVTADPIISKIIENDLKSAGYSIITAKTGDQALALAKAQSPNLVLLDVQLDDLSGVEVCRQLKHDDMLKGSFVVMFSANSDDSASQADGLKANADGYIVMPISNRELVARVGDLLRIRAAEFALRDSQAKASALLEESDKTRRALLSILEDSRHTEARLHEYQRRLENQNLELSKLTLALEQSGSTVVITDTRGAIEYVNPRFTETTGYTLQEALGQNPRILKSGVQDNEFYRNLWQTILAGQTWRGELHNKRKDETLYWEHATIAPVRNAVGQVTHFIAVKEDITELKQAHHELEHANKQLQEQLKKIRSLQAILHEQAIRDPLTGLYNRRYWCETIDRELARATREKYPVSMIMMDLDHFKNINDTFGHAAGDLVLQCLAQILSSATRSGDIVCRYGGEEFTLVLPNTTTEAAEEIAERLRLSFEQAHILWNGVQVHTTLSIGVATFPFHASTSSQLINVVDSTMYQAKNQGRNRVVIYTPTVS